MARSIPKTPRSSPRCTKCDNRPLRSQCIHTVSGKLYLKSIEQQEAADVTKNSMAVDSEPLIPVAPPMLIPTSSPPSTPVSAPIPTLNMIDPTLLSAPLPQFDTNMFAPSTPSSTAGSNPFFGTLQTPVSPRVRPTAENALHGRVEGAKRGNMPFQIIRPRRLPPTIQDSRVAGARFYRLITDLVARCERISVATNCWLFVGAQHLSATFGLVSYASPRLRRDAKPELSALQNQFNAVVAALLTSRRRDAVVLALELDSIREEKKKAAEEVQEARHEVETRDQTILAQKKVIADLLAMVDCRST